MRRLFLAAHLACAFLIVIGLTSTPALAQSWVPYWLPCDASGNVTGNGGGSYSLTGNPGWSNQTNYPTNFVLSAQQAPSPGDIEDGIGELIYAPTTGNDIHSIFTDWIGAPPALSQGTVSMTASGQLTAYFKWEPYPGGAPLPNATHNYLSVPGCPAAPTYVDILLVTDVSASAGVSYGADDPETSGLTASASASDSPLNDTATASAASSGSGGSQEASSRILERASVGDGGIAEVYINGNGEASLSNSVTWGGAQASASADVSATAAVDNREVAITSYMDPNYYKGPGNTPTLVPPSLDGSKLVDSAVTWDAGLNEWYSGGTFTCTPIHFANPQYSWGGGINGVISENSNGTNELQLGFGFPSTGGNSLGQQSTIECSVTDAPRAGDGSTGANTYTINWHYPYENWDNYASGNTFWQGSTFQAQSSGNYNGNADCTYTTTDAEGGWNTALADMFTAGSGLVDPPWAGFLTTAGLGL